MVHRGMPNLKLARGERLAEPLLVQVDMHLDVHVDESVIDSVVLALDHAYIDIRQHTLLTALDNILAAQVGPLDRLHVVSFFRVTQPAIPVRLADFVLLSFLIRVFFRVVRLEVILFDHGELAAALLL